MEMGGGAAAAKSPFMKEFFNKVEQIKRNMDQIKKNMVNLDKKHGMQLSLIVFSLVQFILAHHGPD
jgi:hypothetical protein